MGSLVAMSSSQCRGSWPSVNAAAGRFTRLLPNRSRRRAFRSSHSTVPVARAAARERTNLMTTRRARFAIAGLLLGATALVGARAAWLAPPPAGTGPTTVTAPGGGRVTFTGTMDRTRVLRGGDGSVRMELVMRAGADAERAAIVRRPTDLVIVLDRSGSMGGEKIEQARAAVRELVGQLGPEDRFALVTYANFATVTIPFATADDRARGGWLETLASCTADGGTNISHGL